jgi:hypothetical protein
LVSSPNLSFLKVKIHFVNKKGFCPPKIRRGDKTKTYFADPSNGSVTIFNGVEERGANVRYVT